MNIRCRFATDYYLEKTADQMKGRGILIQVINETYGDASEVYASTTAIIVDKNGKIWQIDPSHIIIDDPDITGRL